MRTRPVVWRDGIASRDYLLATLAGVAFTAAVLVYGVPGLDPSLWDEVAVASGVRPPRTIFPGLWRALVSWMFPLFGIRIAVGILSFAGAVAGGVSVALVALSVRQMLMFLLRTTEHCSVWTRRIAPFFAFLAAALLGMSDPMWRLAQTLSPDGLRFLGMTLAMYCLLRWLNVGGGARLYPSFMLMGVLAAETPLAFLMPFLFVCAYWVILHGVMDGNFDIDADFPRPYQMPKWRMFFSFLGGFALACWLNVQTFVSQGGLTANGWLAADVYFRYFAGFVQAFTGAASIAGWGLGFGFGVLPLLATVCIFPMVAHDDRPMQFRIGVLLFFSGFLGVLQSGAFPEARFWTFLHEIVIVPSGFLLAAFVMCSTISVALLGAGFAQECQQRWRVDGQRPPLALRALVPALAVLLMLMAAAHVARPVEIAMQKIVSDALEETVRECGDAKWLFTDGRLDAGIELLAADKGLPLRTFNLMSGASNWEKHLRTRFFEKDTPDWTAAETGVPTLLRVWAGEKDHGMDEAAIQLGFDFWKRERQPLPKQSGLVAREKGIDDAEAARGVAEANALAKRILDLAPAMEKTVPSPALASAVSAVSWRISRFARLREDDTIADGLDNSNGALKKLLSLLEYERIHTFMQMTPREGLDLALYRADFIQARPYALAVLRNSPDDVKANFAMGMSFLRDRNYLDAEKYLTVCLKTRPEEPAVLNNLSIIYRKTHRYEESVTMARMAIKRMPESPEIKKTLAAAEEAQKKFNEEKTAKEKREAERKARFEAAEEEADRKAIERAEKAAAERKAAERKAAEAAKDARTD